MKIGIIGPSEMEIMPFINKIENKKLTNHSMLKFYSGVYEGVDVVSVFCGVCKVNAAIATQIMIDKFEVTHVVLTGVAGGLHAKLKIYDTVIATEVAYHDVAHGILTEYHPWMEDIYFKSDTKLLNTCKTIIPSLPNPNKFHFGRIITGESFITHKERQYLIDTFKPLCVDMESASVAHVCYVNNIPFIAIRSLSDNADETGSENFENNGEVASINSLTLVEELIKNIK